MVEAKERVLLFFEGAKPDQWRPIPRSQMQVVFPAVRDKEPGGTDAWTKKRAARAARSAEAA